jgi:hypothetical protein
VRRQDHAIEHRFRHSPRAFVELLGDDVRLLEVRLIGVEDDRLALAERVIEQRGQSRVPPLEHARRVLGRRLFGRVIVDVEVRCAQDFEFEPSRTAPCCDRSTARPPEPHSP